MRGDRPSSPAPTVEPDVTPLIDVMLTLPGAALPDE